MLSSPSLTIRIGMGKLVGFAVGLIGVGVLTFMGIDLGLRLEIGLVLWYATLGALIGVFGPYDHHPIIKMPLPWWLMAVIIGAWMNFVLVLVAYEPFVEIMQVMFGENGLLQSPMWFVVEGAVVGLLIGWFANRAGGYGPATVANAST